MRRALGFGLCLLCLLTSACGDDDTPSKTPKDAGDDVGKDKDKDAGVPGMRSRQLGMSPAKIAIAVAVTIEAIAGTGGMKKVTGTRSAVAIVAVRPGMAPTNKPKSADATITHSTYGSNTSANA